MKDIQITVSYERKISDTDFGSEGVMSSLTAMLESGEDEAAARAALFVAAQREALTFLANHASNSKVARRASAEAAALGIPVDNDPRTMDVSIGRLPRPGDVKYVPPPLVATIAMAPVATPVNGAEELEDLPF